MTLLIRIIIILSCDVLICNLPVSHGIQNNQGYHLSTIGQVLTPGERLLYELFGTLPNRIYYSNKKHCYVVREQKGHYENNIRRQKGKRYKTIPRWEYYLDKLSPMSLIKSGLEFVSIGKSLVCGGGFDDFGDGDDGVDGGTNGDVDIGTDNAANDATDDADNNEKEPGLLSKGIDMGMGLMSPLFNLFGGSKDANNNNNNNEKKDENDDKKDEKKDDDNDKKDEKKDDDNDKKDEKKDDDNDKKDEKKDDNKDNEEGDKPADSQSYMDMAKNALKSEAVGMAKDVLQSDTAKEIVKTGISMFVPGGQGIVAAMEAVQKYQKADAAIDKVEGKIPKLK